MARIRSIKPEFWDSPTVGQVSRDARLLFIATWNLADDHGRYRAAPGVLLGEAFPFDEDVSRDDVKRWRDELDAAGLIRLYEVEGRSYLEIGGWDEHQRIDKPGKPWWPAPNGQVPDPGAPATANAGETDTTPSHESRESPATPSHESRESPATPSHESSARDHRDHGDLWTPPNPPTADAKPAEPAAVAGGEDQDPPKDRAERAVDRLRRSMPPPLAQRLDKQHQQAIDVVVPLALAGWQPRELADQLGQRGWDGVQDPARVLAKRAQALADVEPPSLRARREQARDPPGCPNEAQHGAMVDDEGRPEPCSCGWTPADQYELAE
jgi:hypothetical protein